MIKWLNGMLDRVFGQVKADIKSTPSLHEQHVLRDRNGGPLFTVHVTITPHVPWSKESVQLITSYQNAIQDSVARWASEAN